MTMLFRCRRRNGWSMNKRIERSDMTIEIARGGLPGDAMYFRFGIDGSEPRELGEFLNIGHGNRRLTVALNTHYEEICGKYYVNKALIALVQTTLASNGIFVVLQDI